MNKNKKAHGLVPAEVVQAGYAQDGNFYLQTKLLDPNTSKVTQAFVRLKDEGEIKQHYKEMNNLDDATASREAAKFMTKFGHTRDLDATLTKKIEDSKAHGHFADVSNEEIKEQHLTGGVVVMLRGVDIIADAKSQDPNNKVVIATANSASFTGMVKDHAFMQDGFGVEGGAPSPAAGKTVDIQTKMVRFLYAPASKANNHTATAHAFSIESADNMNFQQISGNPAKFNGIIDRTSRPFSEAEPSVARNGFTDMNISYKDENNHSKTYRMSYYPNSIDGGERFGLSGAELEEVASAWEDDHQYDISRLQAMQDNYTTTANPNPKIIAKMDFMRIGVMAANQPNAFKTFLDKVNKRDPDAFAGVTKIDYMKTATLSPDQQAVLDITKAIAKDPTAVLMNIAVYDKLNIPHDIQKQMTNHLSASYNKTFQQSAGNGFSALSKSADGDVSPALAVLHQSKYSDTTRAIKMFVATEVVPSSVQPAEGHAPEVNISNQVFAELPFVATPLATTNKAGDYVLSKDSKTFNTDSFIPPHITNNAISKIDFGDDYVNYKLLSGAKPTFVADNTQHQSNKADAFSNAFAFRAESAYEKVGLIDMVTAKMIKDVPATKSPNQVSRILGFVGYAPSFAKEMNAKNPEPQKAIERHAEFMTTVSELVGGFSKEKTSNAHIKEALLKPYASLDDNHQKIRDMLLTDKMIAIDVMDKELGHAVTKEVNFSDVANVALDASKKIAPALTGDIALDQRPLAFEDFNNYKQERVNQTVQEIVSGLEDKKLTATSYAEALLAKMENPQQEHSNAPVRI